MYTRYSRPIYNHFVHRITRLIGMPDQQTSCRRSPLINFGIFRDYPRREVLTILYVICDIGRGIGPCKPTTATVKTDETKKAYRYPD